MSGAEHMVREYIETARRIRAVHGDECLLMIQCGKFYEVYDVQSAECSPSLGVCERVLHLRVTLKKMTVPLDGDRQPVYCAGVPMEAVDKYRAMLMDKGYALLLIAQDKNDPTVRRVGTLESAGVHRPDGAMAVVLLVDGYVHVARYDPHINAIDQVERACETADVYAAMDEARALVAEVGGCTEVQVHAELDGATLLRAVRAVFVGAASHACELPSTRRALLRDRRWLRRALETHYTWVTALGDDVFAKLGLAGAVVDHVAALVLLVAFLRDHDAEIGRVLPVPNVRAREGELRVLYGLSNLHLFDAPVDRGSLLHVLGEHILTAMGRRQLRERLAAHSDDPDVIRGRQVDIERGRRVVELAPEVAGALRGMRDLGPIGYRVRRGAIAPSEIARLIDAHARAERVFDALPDAAMQPTAEARAALRGLLAFADETFDLDDAEDVLTKGPDADPEVRAARERVAAALAQVEAVRERSDACLKTSATHLLHIGGVAHLVVSAARGATLRKAGWSVRALNKSQASLDDASTAALLLELSDARVEHEHACAHAFRLALERMRELYFDTHSEAISATVGLVDMAQGLARFFDASNYCAPTVIADAECAELRVEGLRHPIAERLVDQRGLAYVANDARLASDEGWLLYGVNSAGKSSLLKAFGLAVLLAQAGLYVPATTCSIAPYAALALHVGGGDDLFRHQSTFVKELEQLRSVLRASVAHGSRLLFLADELGNATEDASAVKLVASLLHTLQQRRATVAIATHMFALQHNPYVAGLGGLRNRHLAVGFTDDGGVVFERRVLEGLPPERDYGCRIAALLLREDEAMVKTMASDWHTRASDASVSGPSRYNRHAIAQTCDVCGHRPTNRERPLHWHHLQEQRTADAAGRLPDGTHVHAYANLARLCEDCHHRVHHGELRLDRFRDTDHGRELA